MRLREPLKKALAFSVVSGVLLFVLFHWWAPGGQSTVDIGIKQRAAMEELLRTLAEKTYNDTVTSYGNIPYHIKDNVAGQLSRETCECLADEGSVIPFSHLLFPRVLANNLRRSFLGNHKDPAGVDGRRSREYEDFKRRTYTSADLLVVAEANSPLQYPTQGVEVRPLRTIVVPGLGLKGNPGSGHAVTLTAALGVFDVAATVDGVTIAGAGEESMVISSPVLSGLNRQLQFVTYTNTRYHPRTADTVTFATDDGHRAVFTIKVGHGVVPKLYDSGAAAGGDGEYNISALVTIATKTFLRYDKLRDLIDSVRAYYPTVTIVVADDSERPQPVTGPHVEHYTMPFGKGWFAGRNLAVSQVSTKYVLWVDDDFIFSASTKLEKMVDVLEKTTLDLVAGAVREATGFTATFRHTIAVEEGGDEGDCLHIREGHHHVIDGFPNCVVADAVINFFMARTDKVREVGFDPCLARGGHLEFFVDGLGSLHVGSCDDVVVGHASKVRLPWRKMSSDEKAYRKFRYATGNCKTRDELFYFKNRFKCKS